MENFAEYFANQRIDILINEADDHFVEAADFVKDPEKKKIAHNFIDKYDYTGCFDYLWPLLKDHPDMVYKLAWALRNYIEWKDKCLDECY